MPQISCCSGQFTEPASATPWRWATKDGRHRFHRPVHRHGAGEVGEEPSGAVAGGDREEPGGLAEHLEGARCSGRDDDKPAGLHVVRRAVDDGGDPAFEQEQDAAPRRDVRGRHRRCGCQHLEDLEGADGVVDGGLGDVVAVDHGVVPTFPGPDVNRGHVSSFGWVGTACGATGAGVRVVHYSIPRTSASAARSETPSLRVAR